MMFLKFLSLFVISIMTLMFIFLNYSFGFVLGFDLFSNLMFSEILNFSFVINLGTLTFLIMVFSVTSYISLYSEIYMESYNIKKYILLFLFFFLSMLMLILSSSSIVLVSGWDYLGLSSIFLVMFYPNFNSFSNSIYTMFFNRMGDLIVVTIVLIFSMNYYKFYYFFFGEWEFGLLIFLCSLTKSAQFPLSSWLPLAMSAPTPISAMVHSSTLVTAGIFILYKFYMFFYDLGFLFIIIFSSLTFFLGGFMAILELDSKKIIAYSTMSQISMIIYFLSFNFEIISMMHMMFHAFFKSFLFSCFGLTFMSYFMSQNSNILSLKQFNKTLPFLLLFSVFSMTGLIFSMSFYSKDLMLEWGMMGGSSDSIYFSSLLLSCSMFTIIYSCKLLKVLVSKVDFYSNNYVMKKFNVMMFPLVIILISFFYSEFSFLFFSFFNFMDFLIMMFFFFMFLFTSFKFNYFLYYKNFFMEVKFSLLVKLWVSMTKFYILGDLLYMFKYLSIWTNKMYSKFHLYFYTVLIF